jgi:hypothetical protein
MIRSSSLLIHLVISDLFVLIDRFNETLNP